MPPDRPTPLPWQPDPIARVADNLRRGRSVLDASDTGTGKSFHTLFAAAEVGARLAIVSPKSVVPAWTEAARSLGVPLLFCTNIEQLKTGKHPWLSRNGSTWTWRIPDDTALVFDEAHNFAGHNTENGQLMACAPKPAIMLSATAADSPIRMRGLMHQLGLVHWRDWWDWCVKLGCRMEMRRLVFRGGPEKMLPAHELIFGQKLGVRVRIADLGDLFPSQTVDTLEVPIDLTGYEEPPEAKTDLGYLIRERQRAEWGKVPAMAELARDAVESGRSVALFVNFLDNVRRLSEMLDAPFVIGDTKIEEREKIRKDFQANRLRQIVCSADACNQSWSIHDITGKHPVTTLISPGFSATKVLQVLGRARRAKGLSPVWQRFVLAQDVPVERNIRHAIERKKTCIETLNDGDLENSACQDPVLA